MCFFLDKHIPKFNRVTEDLYLRRPRNAAHMQLAKLTFHSFAKGGVFLLERIIRSLERKVPLELTLERKVSQPALEPTLVHLGLDSETTARNDPSTDRFIY